MTQPIIALIAAMAKNRVIGSENSIPWHISEDFQYFKRTTMGWPMIMGRKTFESLPGVLKGRPHIVVTRDREYSVDHDQVFVVHSLAAALERAQEIVQKKEAVPAPFDGDGTDNDQPLIFITGGSQIYQKSLRDGIVERIYLTEINQNYDGDAYFPDFDHGQWREMSRQNMKGDPDYSFVVYGRNTDEQ